MYRQGDVLLVPVDAPLQRDLTYVRRAKGQGIILAAGEATGHHHRVRERGAREFLGTDITGTNGKRFLFVGPKGATITHEEHDTISVPPGEYEIVQQREYEPVIRDNTVVQRASRPVYD